MLQIDLFCRKNTILSICILIINVFLSEIAAQTETKITAGDGAAWDYFGGSAAISGNYAIVGAYEDDFFGNSVEKAYIFIRSGTTWTEQAKLTANDSAAEDNFGFAVSIYGDYAIVGASGDDDNGSSSGSAYIFFLSGTTWTEQAKLTASDGGTNDNFGYAVSLRDSYAVVGARYDSDKGSFSGAAYIFVRSGTTWTEQIKLTASDGTGNDYFGSAVALSDSYLIVGAIGDDDSGSSSGSAYLFSRSGTTWTEKVKLLASDGATDDNFGFAVGIHGDYAVVGAYLDDDSGSASGSAYMFFRSGTTWTEQVKLAASDGVANDQFGKSVAIDGDNVIIGADLDDDKGNNSGSAYIFARSGTTWVQKTKLTASDGATDDQLGTVVSISGDRAIVGAFQEDSNGTNSGSAYIYYLNSAPQLISDSVDTATEDNAFTYVAAATDSDGGSLTITFENLPGWLSASGDSISGTPTEGMGDTSFTVIARDDSLADTLVVSITVIAVNDVPEITTVPETLAYVDSTYNQQVTVTDEDLGDSIFSSTLLIAPSGMTIGSSGLITWAPDRGDVGDTTVSVEATDNNGAYDTLTYTVTVIDIPPAAPSGLSATEGDTVITIQWNSNVEIDLSHYIIYRDTAGGFTPDSSNTITNISSPETTYTDTNVIIGLHYYYIISAVDSGNNESGYSGQTDSPVPVELASFAVRAIGTGVILEWTTQTEDGNLGFNILRSESSTGVFTRVNAKMISGYGTSSIPHLYSHVDNIIVPGTYYYQLEQIDIQGTIHYSNIISITSTPTAIDNYKLQDFFENMIVTTVEQDRIALLFSLHVPQFLTVTLFDINGNRKGEQVQQLFTAETYTVKWKEQVLPGIYFVSIKSSSFHIVRRVLVVR